MEDTISIPDRRLALIFACCHPAIDIISRVTLALSTICGLTAQQVAQASLLSPAAVSQRLTRAKRKLAGGGIIFEVPDARFYGERLEAVLTTVEIAYSRAHSSGLMDGENALLAGQMIELTDLLTEIMPDEAEVHALAAAICYLEARRPARVDISGTMVPLEDQDPMNWDQHLLAKARRHRGAIGLDTPVTTRLIQLEIQHAWCSRKSLSQEAPWPRILALYDRLLELGDNSFARLNRVVAIERVKGTATALEDFDKLSKAELASSAPYHAVSADLLSRSGQKAEAIASYDEAISLQESLPERRWLEAKRDALASSI